MGKTLGALVVAIKPLIIGIRGEQPTTQVVNQLGLIQRQQGHTSTS